MCGHLLGRWSWTPSVVGVEHSSIEVEEVNDRQQNITEPLVVQTMQLVLMIHLNFISVTSLSTGRLSDDVHTKWVETCSLRIM